MQTTFTIGGLSQSDQMPIFERILDIVARAGGIISTQRFLCDSEVGHYLEVEVDHPESKEQSLSSIFEQAFPVNLRKSR